MFAVEINLGRILEFSGDDAIFNAKALTDWGRMDLSN
jgi:hypothetical protein